MSRRVVERSDGVFDATAELPAVHDAILAYDETHPRSLDCLDLFAGQGTFANICADAGKRCCTVDVLADGINQNILTRQGFFHILFLTCSLETSLKPSSTQGPFWRVVQHLDFGWGYMCSFMSSWFL